MAKIGKYTYIPGNSTVVVSDIPCTLISVNINNQGSGGNTLTIYDNTSASGTPMAVIDTSEAKDTINYSCIMKVGCTAVLATGTTANITIVTG